MVFKLFKLKNFCSLKNGRAWVMIEDCVIERIQKLLDEGCMTHRKIAETVGVSRGLVSQVARGERRSVGVRENGLGGASAGVTKTPSYKCSGCNRNVTTIPCIACQAESFKVSSRL